MGHALKLEDLAHRAGVSPRTVRYYIQRGLLPPADFKGPDTAYGERHLLGLKAIRRLQEAYWPLEAIASALLGKDEAALRKIAGGEIPRGHERAPAVDVSASSPPSEPHPLRRAHLTRIALAPGVELLVDEHVPESARALVERITELAQSSGAPSVPAQRKEGRS